jgi:hypothetical protein
MNREEIQNLKIDDYISVVTPTRYSEVLPESIVGEPQKVVRISFRGVSCKKRHYVGFNLKFGKNSTISGSVTEGDANYIVVSPKQREGYKRFMKYTEFIRLEK